MPSYVQDLELPHMVHGRAVRPPSYQARSVQVDTEPVAAMDGVLQVVHDGSFLAVIAAREEQAIAAAEELARRALGRRAAFPAQDAIFDHLTTAPARFVLDRRRHRRGNGDPTAAARGRRGDHAPARYERPFQMHASLGPSAAVAHFVDGTLTVWAQTQASSPAHGHRPRTRSGRGRGARDPRGGRRLLRPQRRRRRGAGRGPAGPGTARPAGGAQVDAGRRAPVGAVRAGHGHGVAGRSGRAARSRRGTTTCGAIPT
ncbi:MAG: hypothetical protein R2854_26995 [Caldilineaceae bacterium]